MNDCERIQIELSAFLDGESDLRTAFELMDHLTRCDACRAFWRDMRADQDLLDQLVEVPAKPVVATIPVATIPVAASDAGAGRSGFPRWAWGLAAVLILAVGIGAIGLMDRTFRDQVPLPGELLSIQLEEDRDALDEQRFMQMTTRLLRADGRYRREMYEILDTLRPPEAPDESPRRVASLRNSRRDAPDEVFSARGPVRIVN